MSSKIIALSSWGVARGTWVVGRGSLYAINQGHCCAVCNTRKMVMVSPLIAYTMT